MYNDCAGYRFNISDEVPLRSQPPYAACSAWYYTIVIQISGHKGSAPFEQLMEGYAGHGRRRAHMKAHSPSVAIIMLGNDNTVHQYVLLKYRSIQDISSVVMSRIPTKIAFLPESAKTPRYDNGAKTPMIHTWTSILILPEYLRVARCLSLSLFPSRQHLIIVFKISQLGLHGSHLLPHLLFLQLNQSSPLSLR